MKEKFFNLPKKMQKDILIGAQNNLDFPPNIIEKDLWICAVLNQLFTLPIPMVFKGGTSLSKGFGLIDRFSEDIDVTIDYRFLSPKLDLSKSISKNALKNESRELKEKLLQFVKNVVLPHLEAHLARQFTNESFRFELSDDGEKLRIYYPSFFEQENQYFQHNVLLEFGARNSIEPYDVININSFLSALIPELEFPSGKIPVLSPMRTFWEKATLIHVECHRGRLHRSPERLSRHWYDLVKLSNSWVGNSALKDRALLEDVVLHKKVFFNTSYANYDDCIVGKFLLLPKKEELNGLMQDYKDMQNSGMFSKTSYTFEDLIEHIKKLETSLNSQ